MLLYILKNRKLYSVMAGYELWFAPKASIMRCLFHELIKALQLNSFSVSWFQEHTFNRSELSIYGCGTLVSRYWSYQWFTMTALLNRFSSPPPPLRLLDFMKFYYHFVPILSLMYNVNSLNFFPQMTSYHTMVPDFYNLQFSSRCMEVCARNWLSAEKSIQTVHKPICESVLVSTAWLRDGHVCGDSRAATCQQYLIGHRVWTMNPMQMMLMLC